MTRDPAKRRAQKTRYRSSARGKATELAYRKSAARKAYYENRNNSPERKAYMVAYRKAHQEQRAAYRKREANRALRGRIRQRHISRHATPPWANLKAISRVYEAARRLTAETGTQHVVDHVIPLKGESVCGLHVDNNLRVVPWQANIAKGNRLTLIG